MAAVNAAAATAADTESRADLRTAEDEDANTGSPYAGEVLGNALPRR
jgi:hypothetical protein